MTNEFDKAYEFVIKSCNYMGSICSLKDEIEVWEKKEERKRGGGSLWIKAFGPELALDLLFSS